MRRRNAMSMTIGPLRFYRANNGSLDISFVGFSDCPWGWEYGWRDPMRGEDRALVDFRIGKLVVLYFQKYKKGFEVWVLGFWWIR